MVSDVECGMVWRDDKAKAPRYLEVIRVKGDQVEVFNCTDLVTTGKFATRQPRRLSMPLARLREEFTRMQKAPDGGWTAAEPEESPAPGRR